MTYLVECDFKRFGLFFIEFCSSHFSLGFPHVRGFFVEVQWVIVVHLRCDNSKYFESVKCAVVAMWNCFYRQLVGRSISVTCHIAMSAFFLKRSLSRCLTIFRSLTFQVYLCCCFFPVFFCICGMSAARRKSKFDSILIKSHTLLTLT